MPFRNVSILTTLGVALLFMPKTAYALVAFTEPIHRIFVFFHIFGAIIFVGNIIVSAMWMAGAKRTRNAHVLHFASRSIARGDWMFTLPGVILVLVTGLLTIGPWGGIPGSSWGELALALLILSGVLWVAVLVRLQKKMVALTVEAVESNTDVDDQYYRFVGRWMMWGGIATLLPIVAVYLMVFKPKLWG